MRSPYATAALPGDGNTRFFLHGEHDVKVFRIHHFYETLVSFNSPVHRLERVGRAAAAAKASRAVVASTAVAAAGGLFPGHVLAVTVRGGAELKLGC